MYLKRSKEYNKQFVIFLEYFLNFKHALGLNLCYR